MQKIHTPDFVADSELQMRQLRWLPRNFDLGGFGHTLFRTKCNPFDRIRTHKMACLCFRESIVPGIGGN